MHFPVNQVFDMFKLYLQAPLFIILLFSLNLSESFAVDILTFAKEWDERNSSVNDNEASSSVKKKETQQPKKVYRSQATTNSSTEKNKGNVKVNVRDSITSARKKERYKPLSSNEPQSTIKIKRERTDDLKTNKNGNYTVDQGHFEKNSSNNLAYQPLLLSNWLKKVINSLKGIPEDNVLKKSLKESKIKINNANKELDEQTKKYEQQQVVLNAVQRKLKLLQSPELPAKENEREDFAAGMAAGFSLKEIIDAYDSYGSQVNKSAFLQGITESVTGGNRLASEEYDSLLYSANERYEVARQQFLTQKKKEHSDWKASFGKKAEKTSDGILFQIIYKGDRHIDPDEPVSISLSRRTIEDHLLEDTDIDGRKIEIRIGTYTSYLKNVLTHLGLHGEASVAMPVNIDGEPDVNGMFYEHWKVRITDSVNITT